MVATASMVTSQGSGFEFGPHGVVVEGGSVVVVVPGTRLVLGGGVELSVVEGVAVTEMNMKFHDFMLVTWVHWVTL